MELFPSNLIPCGFAPTPGSTLEESLTSCLLQAAKDERLNGRFKPEIPQMEVPLCVWYPWLVGRIAALVSVFGWLIVVVQLLSHIRLFVTPWTVACQDLLFMGFFRQEYWNRLPFPSPGDLHNAGIEPTSSAWQTGPLLLCHQGSPIGGLLWLYLTLGPSGQQSSLRPLLDTPAFCTPLAPSLFPAKFMHLRPFPLHQKGKKRSNHFCTDCSPRLPSCSVWWVVCGN